MVYNSLGQDLEEIVGRLNRKKKVVKGFDEVH